MKGGIVLLLILLTGIVYSQDKKSRADVLYFEYSYKSAIAEYKKEQLKKPLANKQLLNLADAYIKTGDFKNASDTYLAFYKKDTAMPSHDFNKMLRALAKTSGMERVKAFLATKTNTLSDELLENAEFNSELLASDDKLAKDFNIFNVSINSPQADFSPTFYDENRLLFTSSRSADKKGIYGPSGESYLDIYVARIAQDGDILNNNPFSGIPKTSFHKSTPYYSTGLNRIFYILSNAENGRLSFDENGKNALALGVSDGKGSFDYLLRDLSTSFYYPFYDAATGKLYFAANFSDSYGGTDIYFVYTNNGQIMSAPVNLGPRINTPGNEIAPFLFDNSFYFASDVFYGLGGMDVYETKIQSDGTFSIPINLGSGINSSADDFGFIIKNNATNGLKGYFASNRAGGKGNDDIYGFRVSEKPGLKTLVLKGNVIKPNSKQGIEKAAIRVMDTNKNLLKELFTKENGDYQLEIPWRDGIILEITKERYSTYYTEYDEAALEVIQKTGLVTELALFDDLVQERENQKVIKLGKFFFNKGKADVTPAVATELDKVVYAVTKFPEIQLRIESHTDSRGTVANNLKLSQNRSNAIKQYLIQKGVPAKNILDSKGFGEERITNNCKKGVFCLDMLHEQNERSLIVVLNANILF